MNIVVRYRKALRFRKTVWSPNDNRPTARISKPINDLLGSGIVTVTITHLLGSGFPTPIVKQYFGTGIVTVTITDLLGGNLE